MRISRLGSETIMADWNTISEFENTIAEFFGSRYAVSVDCCTHAVELSLRLLKANNISCPTHTYLSIPMTFMKLGLEWDFRKEEWKDYYYIGNTNIIDAAVLWREKSYIPGTLMCLSFQFRKHLKLGRGGMILTDDYSSYKSLKEMSYDGRFGTSPWAEQNIENIGYHYYMTPETAELGLKRFKEVKNITPQQWSYKDYPDISLQKVFK
jgi:dTDP-4-amino-4,6-dideoxygalactose transaminase